MNEAFICDAIRTPFGRYGGALSSVRADDLGAIPLRALMAAQPRRRLERGRRRASTAAPTRPARTTATSRAWRRCWPACRSTCPARRSTACAARAWTRSAPRRARSSAGEAALMIAGGVESMSRAPFVMAKADSAFSRSDADLRHDDRLALRQQADEGACTASTRCRRRRRTSRPTTRSSRDEQDRIALRSQQKAARGAEARASSRRRSCR